MANNNTKELIQELFQGMDGFVQSKTVVGERIKLGDTVLIPLMELSCGMASGAFVKENNKKGDGGAGAMSSKISPAAMLVIQNGRTKLIRVKNEDAFSKIIDMIPDAIDKVKKRKVRGRRLWTLWFRLKKNSKRKKKNIQFFPAGKMLPIIPTRLRMSSISI